jgi:zinc/manganese transport system substrate-binding protein
VTSLISSFSQDPHEFEASASDQLTVSKAQLLIENGGGYDPFLDGIIAASGTKAPLISAVAFSPEWTGDDPTQPVEGFNEHVFYDPQVMVKVADEIAAQLGKIDPDAADDSPRTPRRSRTTSRRRSRRSSTRWPRPTPAKFFVTEPVPAYLAEAAARQRDPDAFSEAVEEGNDVPATLLEALNLIGSGDVKVVFINAQAAGAETTEVENKAAEVSVPVIKASELLPDGKTYVTWMADMATQIKNALSQ